MSSMDEIAVQNRKLAKTCVEKKRRDRINRCLDELKEIMSQSDDKARYQKMEKAEILEMAVAYMRNATRHGADAGHHSYYVMAYQQCLAEFQNYLSMVPGVRDDFKSRMLSHMSQRYTEVASAYSAKMTEAKRSKSHRHSPYSYNRHKKESSSESSLLYERDAKFGGSCSSLDSYLNVNVQPGSPFESENTYDVQNLSANSSPALSQCSSPVSSKKCDLESNMSMSNSSCDMVWRPW
ncbi:transcription factor HES-4 isoform X1 [Brachionus plicatilis]|uniref:Transcription factor HES-4 isoform X1 n=1 Tax=Brachionus plicatilis TaxID=10195 RepID=A0A3M7S5I9_BRAPC|nr:transcription factor HES-4 isoform X1 [Brachionus plicatilis]